MKLIKKIKIRYFRSIYIVNLESCSSLNVISGRNDCGKSNIIRSLNLFFNEQTDWQSKLEFYHDFSAQRLNEVRQESVKGKQFISVEIEFNRPSSYSGSLPPNFIVKRTWLRESLQFQETSSLDKQHFSKLPSSLATARRGLQTFLNRIHFEYVPAIKDRAYSQHLLARLQKTLLDSTIEDSTGIPRLATNLAKRIQSQVSDLQDDFFSATGLATKIQPPRELSELFQAFSVATENNVAATIPLSSRGDGMQARYLSSVLNYIAIKSNKFFIWGFEEPENSLEYRHAEALANDFALKYAKTSQIFTTTHSPAFISLPHDDVACFRVFQEEHRTTVINLAEKNTGIHHRSQLDHELGILKIQKQIHDLYAEKMADLANVENARKLAEEELRRTQMSLLLVEGKTDKSIIEIAWRKLRRSALPFRIRVADPAANGQTGGTGMLAKTIEGIHPDDGRSCVALFDQDAEGIATFSQLTKNFSHLDDSSDTKIHTNGVSYALLLPAPDFRSEYVKAKNHMIEFMFEDQILDARHDGHGLKFKKADPVVIINGAKIMLENELITPQIEAALVPHRKIQGGKESFAEIVVPRLPRNAFSAFELLFTKLESLPNFLSH
jgi:AAA15 family ATPase/GTPase